MMSSHNVWRRYIRLYAILMICMVLAACGVKTEQNAASSVEPGAEAEMQQQEDMIALVFRSYDTTDGSVTVKVKNVSEKTILMKEVVFFGEDGEGNILPFEGEAMDVTLEPGEITKKFRYRAVIPEDATLASITAEGYRCKMDGQKVDDIFDEKDTYNVEDDMSYVTPWQE